EDRVRSQRGGVERFLRGEPALGEGSGLAQDPRQPRLRPEPQACTGRAKLPVCSPDVPPQQLNRPAKDAAGSVCLPQSLGCFLLQGASAERGCKLEGLLARRNGAVEVSRYPEYNGHLGQHKSQLGPVVEYPGQALGLAQQGEAPPILSQLEQGACQREVEIEGQPLGVTALGQLPEGLEGLLKGSHRFTERGVVEGPDTGLLTVVHGFVPDLTPHGMVRQAFDLIWVLPSGRKALRPRSHLGRPLRRERLDGFDQARVQYPPPL